ncbi:hypothetical protein [Streptomyces sp. NPDC057838]|uniref:hypothetical protein n=1 Tax=unclassified Streptomyces TaxID=2593676 RepID=UPI0036983F21
MLSEANVQRALAPCRSSLHRFRAALRKFETTRTRVDYLHDPLAAETIVLVLLSLVLLVTLAVAPWSFVATAALLTGGAGFAVWRNHLWRMHVRHNSRELVLKLALFVRAQRLASAERWWLRDLQVNGVGPLMIQVVEALLGDDHDALLLPDGYEGLRSPRSRQYVIGNEASRRLSRKMAQLEGGTIAVSGPRGAGKSTLLESCAEEADFAVVVQAPASYSPYEFLVSLYIRVCEKYLTLADREIPEFARLSAIRRVARRLVPAVSRGTRYLVFAMSAGALITLGLAATARSVGGHYGEGVLHRAEDVWTDLADTARAIWRGERVDAALTVTVTGVLLWRLRRSVRVVSLVRTGWLLTSAVSGYLLVIAAPVSLLFDPDVHRNARDLIQGAPLSFLLAMAVAFIAFAYRAGEFEWKGVELVLGSPRVRRAVMAVLLVCALVILYRVQPVQAIATDAGNLPRIACVLLGLLLIRAGSWSIVQPEPPLVTKCRNELFRLQTVQTSSSAVTAGPPQLLTAHTSTLSTVPPAMPELVADFRELLTSIAQEQFARKGRVVIAIDEVDRLGSDTQALAFLGEIKAILGVPRVHYLISVAEDVGASFVRRGLPHRGVTDSSLDDIVHVQPCTLAESKNMLERRAPELSEPYRLLAHALSGGLPRDLIRYGLRIMEIEDKTRFFELTDLSRQMILEELAETLAGFRTLLGKEQWTTETSAILLSIRSLMGHLQYLCPCPSTDLHRALQYVAFYDLEQHLGSAAANVPEPTRLLIDEASTYVFFSLTLLDIFGRPDLARRRADAAQHGPDGNPDLLAQARQELEVSPYSARPLIAAIRSAWGLVPEPPSNTVTAMPRARTVPCSLHSPTA